MDIIQLHKEGYSNKQIAEKLNLVPKSVVTMLNRKGLKSNRGDLVILNQETKDLILASILGDGSFDVNDYGGTRMSFAHSKKQKDYCIYKHKVFDTYNIAGKIAENRIEGKRYKKGYFEEIRFRTKTNKVFKEYYNRFFVNKKRDMITLNKEEFTERVLALWYFDDGSICSASYQFTCESLSLKEVENIISILDDNFSIKASCDINNNIYIKKESIPSFEAILNKYIPVESLRYKIRGSV